MIDMILKIIDDFYFRNWGFKKHLTTKDALITLKNYNRAIKGTRLDTGSMKRYIKRVKAHFDLL